MSKKWKLAGVIAALMLTFACVGCSSQTKQEEPKQETGTPVRVASLKGPTSLGLVDLMRTADAGGSIVPYEFTIAGTADEIVPKFIQGEVDIALVPANVASVLYNKMDGAVRVLDINTLGVLSVLTADDSIVSFADLAGHTVVMTGKGTTPDYVMQYLLAQMGIADQVTLDFKSEATEVAAVLTQDPNAIAVLPQPYATTVCAKNADIKKRVDLTEVWSECAPEGSSLVTGVTVTTAQFIEDHPNEVISFIGDQSNSVSAVNADPEKAGELVAQFGIIDNAGIATKAIPACHLVCITGEELYSALGSYLEILYQFDPSAVGGALPAGDFYYTLQ